MSDNVNNPMFERHDILAGLSLLTRLWVPVDHERAGKRAAIATWSYPISGLIVGALGGFVLVLAQAILIPSGFAAALAMAVMIMATGGLHEDGLADCADGFWGAHEKGKRLEIMKDSAIGTYGTLALILTLIASWSAIEALVYSNPIITLAAIGAVSRLPMIAAMILIKNAREDGLSANVGIPPLSSLVMALAISTLCALIAFGLMGLVLIVIIALISAAFWRLAEIKIGGQTGDVLGATQKLAELTALCFAVMF